MLRWFPLIDNGVGQFSLFAAGHLFDFSPPLLYSRMTFGIDRNKLFGFFYLLAALPYSSTLDIALSPPSEDANERDTPTEQIPPTHSTGTLRSMK